MENLSLCRGVAQNGAPGENTTIGVVATNAPIRQNTNDQESPKWRMDGMARAINPTHTLPMAILCSRFPRELPALTASLTAIGRPRRRSGIRGDRPRSNESKIRPGIPKP